MAYPTITEKRGSFRCGAVLPPVADGVPVGEDLLTEDPGWFAPHPAEADKALRAASTPAGNSTPAGPVPDPTEAP